MDIYVQISGTRYVATIEGERAGTRETDSQPSPRSRNARGGFTVAVAVNGGWRMESLSGVQPVSLLPLPCPPGPADKRLVWN